MSGSLSKLATPSTSAGIPKLSCEHHKSPDELHQLCGGCRKARKIKPCTWTDRCLQCKDASDDEFRRYLDFVQRNERRQLNRSTPVKSRHLPLRSGIMEASPSASQAPPSQPDKLVVEDVARESSPIPPSQMPKRQPPSSSAPARAEPRVKVTDMSTLSVNDLVKRNFQLPSADILAKAGLHVSTIELAQSDPAMADLPIRQVSNIAQTVDEKKAARQKQLAAARSSSAPSPARSAPAASGDATQPAKPRRRVGTPVFSMPSNENEPIVVDEPDQDDDERDFLATSGSEEDADDDDADEVGTQTSRSDVEDAAVEPATREKPDFRELFAFIADNAQVDTGPPASESDVIKLVPAALDDDSTDASSDRVCLSSTRLMVNLLRQRQLDVKQELKEIGRITPSKHLAVTMSSYAASDNVFPHRAPPYEHAAPVFPEVPNSTKTALTMADAIQIESAAREAVNICDRLNAVTEAMVAFLDALLEEPMFSSAFRFLAKGIMDAGKRATFIATAVMQVSSLCLITLTHPVAAFLAYMYMYIH